MGRSNLLIGIIILLLALLVIGGVVVSLQQKQNGFNSSAVPSASPIPTTSTVPPSAPSLRSSSSPATVTQIKIYLISLNDNGKSGLQVGCGDSIVPVTRTIPTTTTPLKAAMENLLSLDVQYYGQPPLYNSLYNSTLKVDSASITNNKATINLSGQAQLGGECDDPRAIAQLQQTALQFPTVKSVDIFINGVPISQVFTERGA